jgi:DNA-binding CsgD family transcriptional regulator
MELLERQSLLELLEEAFQSTALGEGRVALVSGEAGIGKTSLVEQFTREHQSCARLLWGACDALFTPRPLGPLFDIAPQIGSDFLDRLNLEASGPNLFAALLRELQLGAIPTIVVFEDVHWADEATLDLIKFLSRRISRTAALLILTYRDDEVGPRHLLRSVLGDLATSTITRRITLAPLSESAVRALVGSLGIDAAALHRRTGGNPFFVTEVLASPMGSLPPTVRDAVLARAARLSPLAQSVLQAAAVIGPRIEPGLLTLVTGADGAAEECLALGMLVAQGETLAFRHELARQTLLESIPLPHQIQLHGQVLEVLKAAPSGRTDFARLAHHAEATGGREDVLRFAPAAARQAALASAHRAAASLYALALRFAGDLPSPERARLLESYAGECFLIDQQLEGIEARRTAIAIWQREGNLLKEGDSLTHLTSMLIAAGQNAEADRACQAATGLLEQLPAGRELAMAYRVRGTLHLVRRDCREAIVWAEKALDLARRFGDASVEATAHNTIGTALLFVDYERGCEYLEQSLASAKLAGLNARAGTAYSNLGSGSGELYQFARARRYLLQGIAYGHEHDLDYTRTYMLAWLALTHLQLGDWEEAGRIGNEVLNRSDLSVIARFVSLVALGRLRARRGDPGIEAALDEALDLATQMGILQRLAPAHAARAEAAWLRGEGEQTLAEARAVYELAVSRQHPWFTGELAYWRWRAGEPVSLPEWAARPFALQIAGEWQAAAEAWEGLGCPYEQARALAEGDAAAQVQALELFDRLGARPAAEALRQRMRTGGGPVPRGPRSATRENPFGLTARQLEVLQLLAEDLSNAEIAARLHISAKTVDHHVSAVLAKLDVRTREEAVALSLQQAGLRPAK